MCNLYENINLFNCSYFQTQNLITKRKSKREKQVTKRNDAVKKEIALKPNTKNEEVKIVGKRENNVPIINQNLNKQLRVATLNSASLAQILNKVGDYTLRQLITARANGNLPLDPLLNRVLVPIHLGNLSLLSITTEKQTTTARSTTTTTTQIQPLFVLRKTEPLHLLPVESPPSMLSDIQTNQNNVASQETGPTYEVQPNLANPAVPYQQQLYFANNPPFNKQDVKIPIPIPMTPTQNSPYLLPAQPMINPNPVINVRSFFTKTKSREAASSSTSSYLTTSKGDDECDDDLGTFPSKNKTEIEAVSGSNDTETQKADSDRKIDRILIDVEQMKTGKAGTMKEGIFNIEK